MIYVHLWTIMFISLVSHLHVVIILDVCARNNNSSDTCIGRNIYNSQLVSILVLWLHADLGKGWNFGHKKLKLFQQNLVKTRFCKAPTGVINGITLTLLTYLGNTVPLFHLIHIYIVKKRDFFKCMLYFRMEWEM